MSFILRSSSYLRNRKRSLAIQKKDAVVQPIETHDFFFDADICASLTSDWTQPQVSLGKLAQVGGVEGLCRALRTDLKSGLLADEVEGDNFQRRISVYGANKFKKKKRKNFLLHVVDQLRDPVLVVLIIAGICSTAFASAQKSEDSSVLEGLSILFTAVAVILIGAGINFNRDGKFRELDDVKDIKEVVVVRAGKEQIIPNTDVLVGDLLPLSTGVSVPCDGVLVSGTANLMCDESALTGETKSVHKNRSLPFFLAGTQVVDGEGVILATALGSRTCWGALLKGLSESRSCTPLECKLKKLLLFISVIGSAFAATIFIVKTALWIKDNYSGSTYQKNLNDFIEIVLISVSLLVVAIPEGLPLAVIITLAFSMMKMYRDNNFVRALAACETMGNVTTICSDKTGTLTKNQMTVVETWPPFNDSPDPFQAEPRRAFQMNRPSDLYCDALLEGIALNSKVFEIEPTENDKTPHRKFGGGNKTEIAHFELGVDLGMDFESIRSEMPIEKAYPFSSETKRSSVLIWRKGMYRMYLKGAAEKILHENCDKIMSLKGEITKMSEEEKRSIAETIDSKVSRGLRCICLAYRDYSASEYNPRAGPDMSLPDPSFHGFTLVAITSLKDPLREDVFDSVRKCQLSGIVARMVTGDHPKTAEFIAAECGIRPKDREDLLVMTGEKFRAMTEEKLRETLPKLRVLARSTPQDKEKLVKWYMANNETVAVTGDGANDALALKEANVGLSMGIQGTDVAKEASDIIILDDSFASIVQTVKWGRAVYDNIRKFVQFQLTINVVALLVSFIGSFLNTAHVKDFALPFSPFQLLWTNIIMDTGAALAYSTEQPEDGLLMRKPYRRDSVLINYNMWKHILGQSLYQIFSIFLYVLPVNNPIGFKVFMVTKKNFPVLKTCVFNTFIWMQIFNSINARRINDEWNVFQRIATNWWFSGIFGSFIVLQVIFVEALGKFFKMTHLSVEQWFICIALGAVSLPIGFLLRLIPIRRNYGFIKSDGDRSIAESNGEKANRKKTSK